jgi:geranylgeranyl reductase family protein
MYDLIVVGAGPAGSSAARAAAMAGLDVLILEKEHFPRYKPCGGALSDRAISCLDFPLPDDICERTVTSARVHFRDKIIESHKGYRLSTLVTRSRFDQFLLHKALEAGTNLVTHRVQEYKEKEDHVKVLTKTDEYRTRFLVISSGCQSCLKNSIQERATKDQYYVSVVTEIEEDEEKIEERLHGSLDFYFDAVETGYGWIFPHKGYYSVGIGGEASRIENLKGTMLNFLRRTGFHGEHRLHGHKVPMGGINWRIASTRVLLAGDSAGFVDPLTGEGMHYALRSGQIAAKAILDQDTANISKTYEDMCKKEFEDELSHALWIVRSLNPHRELFFDAFFQNKDILDGYIEIAAAKKTYKNFAAQILPVIIQMHIDKYDGKVYKARKLLKGLLGQERVNIKIILGNRNVFRAGYEIRNGKIARIVDGGLNNPTVSVVATEGAIHRIERSKDPIAAMQKERELRGIAIIGQSLSAKLKLEVLLSSIQVLRIFNNFREIPIRSQLA